MKAITETVRDWKIYDLFCKDAESMFLSRAKAMIEEVGVPWQPRTGGRPAFPTIAKIMCALLKVEFGFDYRTLESHLRSRPDLLEMMGINRAPSKSVIHDALQRIPPSYLEKLNKRLVCQVKKKTWRRTALDSAQGGARRGLTYALLGTNPGRHTSSCTY